MRFWAVLAVVLLSAATVEAEEDISGDVSFWRNQVTMTCPESGDWFSNGKKEGQGEQYTFIYSGSKDTYHCKYNNDKKYYFYVQGKACDNCFELDAFIFVIAIIGDIVGTTILMVIVYKCTKKKTPTGPNQSPTPAAHPGSIPAEPSHYERLSHHTRANDTYSMISKTG